MQPQVGDSVLWFLGARRTEPPAHAVVTKVAANGQLSLTVFHEAGFDYQRNVHHVDSAYLQDHTKVAEQHGGWAARDEKKARVRKDEAA